tara:strand:- start:2352 stop:2684 length:333 start_codon:yes stop_codon:yes gene_type:complete
MSSSGYTPDIGGGPQPSNLITAGTAVKKTANGTVSADNPARKSITIQNHGTNPLHIAMGATASTSVVHFILKASSAEYDGTGGTVDIDSFTGEITAWSSSGTKFTYAEFV